ncbi:MAG TPA: MAPEG family protein [Candidatus Obscuribacterales bacterium]
MAEEPTRLIGTLQERQHRVKGTMVPIVLTTQLAIGIGCLLLPSPQLSSDYERLRYLFGWDFIALLPYLLVMLTIMLQRLNEGAHNPLLGQESPQLAIHCRVMQNTLEQYLVFVPASLVLATRLPAGYLQVLPLLAIGFCLARLVYWKGYLNPQDCLRRSPGVQMTAAITLGMAALALALLIKDGLGF